MFAAAHTSSLKSIPHVFPQLESSYRSAQEAERMFPVAGGTVRAPKKDVLLAGKYIIPKRTTVFLPVRPLL